HQCTAQPAPVPATLEYSPLPAGANDRALPVAIKTSRRGGRTTGIRKIQQRLGVRLRTQGLAMRPDCFLGYQRQRRKALRRMAARTVKTHAPPCIPIVGACQERMLQNIPKMPVYVGAELLYGLLRRRAQGGAMCLPAGPAVAQVEKIGRGVAQE